MTDVPSISGLQMPSGSSGPAVPSLAMPAGYSASTPAVPNVNGLTTTPPTTPAATGGSANNGSIVDYLNSQGKASDYNTRSTLAEQYGISGYTGTAQQNTQLLGMLRSGSTPSASSVPSYQPTPAAANIKVGPSGTVVNGNTGGVVPNAPTVPLLDNNPAGNAAAGAAAVAAGTAVDGQGNPITGFGTPAATGSTTGAAGTTTGTGTTPATPDLSTYAGALAKLEADTANTVEGSQAYQQLNNLKSGLGISEANTQNQPIPIEFITGQQKNLQTSEAAMAAPLEQQVAALQAQRTATLAADQAAVTGLKPESTAIGTSLTSPTTGQQLGGLAGTGGTGTDATNGATDSQILGYLEANGISATRYNIPGMIAAVRAGSSAQDIISGKVNVAAQTAGATAAASNKSQFTLDGNGNLIQVTPTVAGAGASTASTSTPTAFTPKTSTTTTSSAGTAPAGTKFTLASDGVTVLANGTPINLATFKQMTGQTNVADNKVDFSAVQKPATKTTAPATTTKTTAPASTAGPSSTTGLSASANQYFLSGDISKSGVKSSNSINQLNQQVQNYASSLGISNWSAAKVAALNAGDAANYAQAIQYLTTTQRSVSNAEAGFKQVLAAFPGLNSVSSPLWNETANKLASSLTGGQRNAFNAGLTEIANEYSQVFSRGGANTVSSHTSASDIVSGNLSMKDLQGVLTELQAQGNIVVNGAKSTVNQLMSGFGSGGTSSAGGSTYNGITLPN